MSRSDFFYFDECTLLYDGRLISEPLILVLNEVMGHDVIACSMEYIMMMNFYTPPAVSFPFCHQTISLSMVCIPTL